MTTAEIKAIRKEFKAAESQSDILEKLFESAQNLEDKEFEPNKLNLITSMARARITYLETIVDKIDLLRRKAQ